MPSVQPFEHRRRFRNAWVLSSTALAVACSNQPFPSDRAGTADARWDPGSGGATGAGSATSGAQSGGARAAAGGMGFDLPADASPSCAKRTFIARLIPASILFVVDRSASMNCNLHVSGSECERNPETTDPTVATKWQVLTASLKAAFDGLAEEPRVSAGISYFSNDDFCGVQSAPSVSVSPLIPRQVDALKFSLDAISPKGGTPIVGATVLAYKHLHQDAQAEGNRFVVVVTDGDDSCIDKYDVAGDVWRRLLEEEIPNARSVNIRTFVIGAPGSEPAREVLSQMAWLGGTARSDTCAEPGDTDGVCHFDMAESHDLATDLGAALRDISRESALSCVFDVPGQDQEGGAIDYDRLNVTYLRGGSEPVALLQDTSAPCEQGADGWQYNADRSRIRLCGPRCDEIRRDIDARVDIELGCLTRIR